MAELGIFIEGRGGNIGQDLIKVAAEQDIEVVDQSSEADFIALCTPSWVTEQTLKEERYKNQTVIDFSGAVKRKKLGEYGLMKNEKEPWSDQFDARARLFGNTACIAGAVLRGMYDAGLTEQTPSELSIFAVGGRSYAHDTEQNDLKLANRLFNHPHVNEIQLGLGGIARVKSFMPVVAGGFEHGLLVGVSGATTESSRLDIGTRDLNVTDVVGTPRIDHRLEVRAQMESGYRLSHLDFSLGVVIDNLRFVTQNAVDLMHFVHEQRN